MSRSARHGCVGAGKILHLRSEAACIEGGWKVSELNWYVMRVDTNREEKVLALLERQLDLGNFTPFVPKKAYPHTKGGSLLGVELKSCFPGYVFIESEKDARCVIGSVRRVLKPKGVRYAFLYYEGSLTMKDLKGVRTNRELKLHEMAAREYVMREEEKSKMAKLMDFVHVIGGSTACMEEGKVKVDSGPLVGHEGSIMKINKRRLTATLEVGLYSDKKAMTVMLEVKE